jgi:hypothetical protein
MIVNLVPVGGFKQLFFFLICGMIIIPIEDHISGYLNPPIDDLFISRRLVEKTQVPQNSSGSKECLPRYASMARKIAVVYRSFFFSQGPNPYLSHSQPFFLVNTP